LSFKNGVKSIQTAGYNDLHTVDHSYHLCKKLFSLQTAKPSGLRSLNFFSSWLLILSKITFKTIWQETNFLIIQTSFYIKDGFTTASPSPPPIFLTSHRAFKIQCDALGINSFWFSYHMSNQQQWSLIKNTGPPK
jgi:hypothetical protein